MDTVRSRKMIWWKGHFNKAAIRFLDIVFSLSGIILLFPIMILLSLFIVIDSKGGIIYRQDRVGKNNLDFRLFKFRTMYVDADKKGLITVGTRDPRVTRTGAFLRRYKLDEIPQLFNVISGDMSLVGPRPEVRKYTRYYSLAQQMILSSVKPGITDNASIQYSKENEILSEVADPEAFYINVILPEKIKLNLVYIENLTLKNYLKIILVTFFKLLNH